MRIKIIILLFSSLMFNILSNPIIAAEGKSEVSVIIEVEGDSSQQQQYFEKNYPFIKVIARYDVLFQGLALQAKQRHLQNIANLPFVKAVHQVHMYESDVKATSPMTNDIRQLENEQTNFPHLFNDSSYTGKGVRIAVIDTGIDYGHPYLKSNYGGGYDLVDLDADPMETLPEEGIPTVHGTHVAGIIAAQGEFEGVAPDAKIYGYRALGPGGRGTSVQVIAAIEQAIKDEMDIINLSLGNSINGPDYPTSTAVNRAIELGVMVVIANGNDGPDDWTVGSPATAAKAISVGAMSPRKNIYVIEDSLSRTEVPLIALPGTSQWSSEKSVKIIHAEDSKQPLHGNVLFLQQYDENLYETIVEAERAGASGVFIQLPTDELPMFLSSGEEELSIPIIPLSKKHGQWLTKQLKKGSYLAKPILKKIDHTVAPFSSRGPVTGDWTIKPDIIAPGTNILSTVPGGLQEFQGTSMAAPHVAGALALIKEARPTWTNEQIFHAIKTTAQPLYDESGAIFPPSIQGAGLLQVNEAIHTETIIHQTNLSFGKITGRQQKLSKQLTIENMTNSEQTYSFVLPKQTVGYIWELPHTFTLSPYEKKDVTIELTLHPLTLAKGVHQGFLTLQRRDQSYKLPYLFVHETADYPILMGFGFGTKPFTMENYMYQFYLAKDIISMNVDLFQAETLQYEQTLLDTDSLSAGLNQGTLDKNIVPPAGHYVAQITIERQNKEKVVYERDLWIE